MNTKSRNGSRSANPLVRRIGRTRAIRFYAALEQAALMVLRELESEQVARAAHVQ